MTAQPSIVLNPDTSGLIYIGGFTGRGEYIRSIHGMLHRPAPAGTRIANINGAYAFPAC